MRPKEAPWNMQLAMGITAFVHFYWVYPDPLYALLPYDVVYKPYTTNRDCPIAIAMLCLIGFAVLMRSGIHPPEIRAVNLDVDWIYRR